MSDDDIDNFFIITVQTVTIFSMVTMITGVMCHPNFFSHKQPSQYLLWSLWLLWSEIPSARTWVWFWWRIGLVWVQQQLVVRTLLRLDLRQQLQRKLLSKLSDLLRWAWAELNPCCVSDYLFWLATCRETDNVKSFCELWWQTFFDALSTES